MDAFEAIAQRHSTREYLDKPIPRELLEKLIDAGQRAPTARNEQPWQFIIVTDQKTRRAIAGLADYGKFIAQAPACVIVLCRETKYYLEDGCAAIENILLAATALGIQSCWVAGDKKAYCGPIMEMLGVPAGYKLIGLLPLGYQRVVTAQKTRRNLRDILHWERF